VTVNLSRPRPRRAIALAAALTSGLLWFPTAPASAGFGIALRPAHADPNDPATKAYFKPTVSPGQTFTDQVIVTNNGDTPIDLAVSGVDGLTAPTSGAVYANRTDPVKKAGTWVSLPGGTVTVAPHAELPVAFTVAVPKDAGAGDHLAGIAFEDVHPTQAGGNFAVTQVVRAVMGVQVIVPGPGAFTVHVDKAAVQELPGVGAASVAVTLGDNGNRLGKPALSVALTGPNGYQRTVNRNLDTLLPGDTIDYPLAWPDVLQPGDYSITATATAPGSPPVTKTVSSHLGTPLGGVPSPGVVTPAPAPAKHSSSGFPLWIVVVLVAVLGVGGGLMLGKRGHSGPSSDEPALATERSSQVPADH
jgi:hypothetical protein